MDALRIFQAHSGRSASPSRTERRASPRLRTRLRPGKLLDRDLGFLADCAILDRTHAGLRIRCFGDAGAVDNPVAVFDEKDGVVRSGRIVWSRDAEVGVRLDALPVDADASVLRRLSGPYYAVRD